MKRLVLGALVLAGCGTTTVPGPTVPTLPATSVEVATTTTTSVPPSTTVVAATAPTPTTAPPTTTGTTRAPVPTSLPSKRRAAPAPTTATPAPVRATPAPPGGGGLWDSIARCESGGNWAHPPVRNRFGTFSGGLMIGHAYWHANGGVAPAPYLATKAEQIAVATTIAAKIGLDRGWQCYPVPARFR